MKLIIYSIFFSFFVNFVYTACVQGQNCPNGRGKCINNKCICYNSFYSLNYEIYKDDIIFCEYRKMSRFGPLILEFFLPSIGHLYAGKMRFFITKLIIILFPLLCYCCGLTNIGQNPDGTQRDISNITWIFLIIFIISIVILPFFHICDLICYSFGLYYDGNGVPFI